MHAFKTKYFGKLINVYPADVVDRRITELDNKIKYLTVMDQESHKSYNRLCEQRSEDIQSMMKVSCERLDKILYLQGKIDRIKEILLQEKDCANETLDSLLEIINEEEEE